MPGGDIRGSVTALEVGITITTRSGQVLVSYTAPEKATKHHDEVLNITSHFGPFQTSEFGRFTVKFVLNGQVYDRSFVVKTLS